jgi:hypothetical protein
MDDMKNILNRVPDPGPKYWETFPARVERRIERDAKAPARPDRRVLRMAPAITSAAALALVLSLLTTFEPGAPLPLEMSPPVQESMRTVKLAVQEGPQSVLVVLGRAASEKADMARVAFDGGDTAVLLPLARSWEKIVRTGLVRSIEKALEGDEDIEPFVAFLKENVLSRQADWQRMADQSSDPDSLQVLEAAVDATDALTYILGVRFALNGKG